MCTELSLGSILIVYSYGCSQMLAKIDAVNCFLNDYSVYWIELYVEGTCTNIKSVKL